MEAIRDAIWAIENLPDHRARYVKEQFDRKFPHNQVSQLVTSKFHGIKFRGVNSRQKIARYFFAGLKISRGKIPGFLNVHERTSSRREY